MFIYVLREREREREREQGRSRERRRHRPEAGSGLPAVSIEPDAGLEPRQHEIVT